MFASAAGAYMGPCRLVHAVAAPADVFANGVASTPAPVGSTATLLTGAASASAAAPPTAAGVRDIVFLLASPVAPAAWATAVSSVVAPTSLLDLGVDSSPAHADAAIYAAGSVACVAAGALAVRPAV
jgi:hypothetical protein